MAVQAAQVAVKTRNEKGGRANKRLREAGMLPGVVYGHKESVIPITMPMREVVHHLSHGAHLFDLAIDGKSEKVLVKEVQYDHLGIAVLHVDFARVSLDEKVEVTVPLELKGTPKGEADGAVLQQLIAELEVECLVTDIPEVIRHNVSDMEKDSVLAIKDLKFPAGVRCLQDENLLVATVREIQEEVAAPEAAEAGAAEPEIIGKGKEEAAEEGAESAAAPAAEKK
ncbi:MAG TPA: 50S ribosomal protein L25 [Tepidisphaeraceae bacterium]|nr:50S ribosomal protein L25 [Tepidisphaeraceae bacterium]